MDFSTKDAFCTFRKKIDMILYVMKSLVKLHFFQSEGSNQILYVSVVDVWEKILRYLRKIYFPIKLYNVMQQCVVAYFLAIGKKSIVADKT